MAALSKRTELPNDPGEGMFRCWIILGSVNAGCWPTLSLFCLRELALAEEGAQIYSAEVQRETMNGLPLRCIGDKAGGCSASSSSSSK